MNDTFSAVVLPGFDSSTLKVASLFTDARGDTWVGTMDQGLFRIHDRTVSHFSATDGLTSNAVYNMMEDREGNLWTITSEGLDRFRNLAVATYSMHEGLSADKAGNVVAARDGRIWVGNYYAVDVVRAEGTASLGVHEGFPGTMTTTMLEDRDGRMWIAVDDKLMIVEQGRMHRVEFPGAPAIGTIFTLAQDTHGDLWFSNDKTRMGKLFHAHGSQVIEQALPPETQGVFSMAADPKGGLWLGLRSGDLGHLEDGVLRSYPERHTPGFSPLRAVGTASGFVLAIETAGLIVFADGVTHEMTSRNGLPCDSLNSFMDDLQGNLFLNAKCGILLIAAGELKRWWQEPASAITFQQFGALDGARTERSGLTPAATRSPDGRIWFVNERVLQVIDPGELARNTQPPPVAIERVLADGSPYPTEAPITFPPDVRSLQIDYTALSFVAPQKVLFRYRLDGHDTDWQDAGTRRQALYNDLRPGRYRFQVIACNNDGIWNTVGAGLAFDVKPAFDQTLGFKTAVVLAVLTGIWMVYLVRVRQITAEVQGRLGERLTERERIARELHDTLLQGVQGLMMSFHAAVSRMKNDHPDRQLLMLALTKADQVLSDGRDRVSGLRSENETPEQLPQALQAFGLELASKSTVPFVVSVTDVPRILNPALRQDILGIGREALLNAFQHGQATSIEARLSYNRSRFQLVVRDDGKGITPELVATGRPGHWGLAGMRERARKIGADLIISSKPGAGTEIQLSLRARIAYRNTGTREA